MEKRVALYARTSTADKQDTEMQLRELREFAKLRGWKIVSVFQDRGFTGSNANRPELKALMSATERREIDIVLTWKLDRFARSLGDLIAMIQRLGDVGAEFVSLKDNIDLTTSQGRLMLHLLGAFAQFERDLIVSRVRAGLDHAKSKGQKLGRPQVRNDAQIRRLRDQGLTQAAIAHKCGVSEGSVRNGLAKTAKNPIKDDPASA